MLLLATLLPSYMVNGLRALITLAGSALWTPFTEDGRREERLAGSEG